MAKKQKYYVVWQGLAPGIYTTWEACKQQVHGVQGACYKSFDTAEEAEEAYHHPPQAHIVRSSTRHRTPRCTDTPPDVPTYRNDTVLPLPPEVTAHAWAVDAACSGNPGAMEYRGICLSTGAVVFHFGPIYGTNNIGKFLAIVHALALIEQQHLDLTVYSDSRNALGWVRQKKCKTTLKRNSKTEQVYTMIERAERWLQTHTWTTPLLKWNTRSWGEIPADFGRK